MKHVEPPLPGDTTTPLFLVGRDRDGHWVVRNQSGTFGGLFIDRVRALRFAMFESGNQPQAVIMVPGILDIGMGGKVAA